MLSVYGVYNSSSKNIMPKKCAGAKLQFSTRVCLWFWAIPARRSITGSTRKRPVCKAQKSFELPAMTRRECTIFKKNHSEHIPFPNQGGTSPLCRWQGKHVIDKGGGVNDNKAWLLMQKVSTWRKCCHRLGGLWGPGGRKLRDGTPGLVRSPYARIPTFLRSL